MILWFTWKNGEYFPKYKKINFAEERKKELYRRINKMLSGYQPKESDEKNSTYWQPPVGGTSMQDE